LNWIVNFNFFLSGKKVIFDFDETKLQFFIRMLLKFERNHKFKEKKFNLIKKWR